MQALRPVRPARRAAQKAHDGCLTCGGTGLFVPLHKAHEVPLPCPRCRQARSVGFVPPPLLRR